MGVVRTDLGPDATVRVAELDLAATERIRATLPCLEHRRLR
jgi:predicted amidohydrolase